MQYKQAKRIANKIVRMKGEVTASVLIRYGVSEDEAKAYMRWMTGPKGERERKYLKRKRSKRGPIIYYGMNTAKR